MELATYILNLVNFAIIDSTPLNRVLTIGVVTKEQADTIRQFIGVDVSGYEYVIDKSGVKHAFKQHGNSLTEAKRGQTAITVSDFVQIPTILANGKVSYAGKNKIGREVIDFEAELDYTFHCLQEIRTGRRQLALLTLYKRKPPTI